MLYQYQPQLNSLTTISAQPQYQRFVEIHPVVSELIYVDSISPEFVHFRCFVQQMHSTMSTVVLGEHE
jgi:hypothetical protein